MYSSGLKRFVNYIGSRRFAIYLLIITTSIILVGNLLPSPLLMSSEEAEIFAETRPLLFKISNIFHVINLTRHPLFLAIPAFILLSISICTYKRMRQSLSEPRRFAPSTERMKFLYSGAKRNEAEVSSFLEERRWKLEKRSDEMGTLVFARKGEGGIWGSFVFHLGMDVLIIGGIISMMTIFTAKIFLTEGFGIEPREMLGELLSKHEMSSFPYQKIQLESFDFKFKGESFPIDYAAHVKTLDREGVLSDDVIRVNKPLKKGGYQFLLHKYYFAPRFIISDRDGRVLQDAFINLLVQNIQNTDEFEIPETGIKIRARFFPDFVREAKGLSTRSTNLNNPVFLLEFFRGIENIGDGILPLNKKMDFDDGRYTIEFRDIREWLSLVVSRDSGLPVVQAGLVLIVLGLTVRYLLNEKAIWFLVRDSDGKQTVEMGGRSLYFPALFEEEMRRLGEELGLSSIES